jgi:hypothetical protein
MVISLTFQHIGLRSHLNAVVYSGIYFAGAECSTNVIFKNKIMVLELSILEKKKIVALHMEITFRQGTRFKIDSHLTTIHRHNRKMLLLLN